MTKTQQEDHARKLLESFGVDSSSEHFHDTPRRFVAYLQEYFQPFDPLKVLGPKFSANGSNTMVVQSHIPTSGICPHHLLPYLGHTSIGYVPKDTIIGLSKMSRLVKAVTHELPDIQETACNRIAEILDDYIRPVGVIVVMRCIHTCMAGRGVAHQDVPTSTSALRGCFLHVPQAREEFFSLVSVDRM